MRLTRTMAAIRARAALATDSPRMPPPTLEHRRCFTCDGSGFVDDGEFDIPQSPRCPTCCGKRTVPVEVRR